MTKQEISSVVMAQLATDLNCRFEDLNGEKDSYVFTIAQENPGRRPFPRGDKHFEMLSMGNTIVVSATPEILAFVKPQFEGKSRDEAFSMPFVYGHTLYYLPETEQYPELAPPDGFTYELVEKKDIPQLYQFEGFRNAIVYDVNHPRPDVLVTLAKKNGRIVGMAGASNDCAGMWQVGIDVLAGNRSNGLAAYLVNSLTVEIVKRGYVPYYGTASSNIASQRVAHRAGYYPAWVCAYKVNFDGYAL